MKITEFLCCYSVKIFTFIVCFLAFYSVTENTSWRYYPIGYVIGYALASIFERKPKSIDYEKRADEIIQKLVFLDKIDAKELRLKVANAVTAFEEGRTQGRQEVEREHDANDKLIQEKINKERT